jgi:hypothetical protein
MRKHACKYLSPFGLLPFGLLMLTGNNASAQDISPGMWEITVNSVVATSPGFAPPPVTQNQCLTAADARDPRRLFGEIATPGASGCTYGKSDVSGSNIHFTMQCAGNLGLRASGDVSFTLTSVCGSITSSAKLGDQLVNMQSQLSGHRVGNC